MVKSKICFLFFLSLSGFLSLPRLSWAANPFSDDLPVAAPKVSQIDSNPEVGDRSPFSVLGESISFVKKGWNSATAAASDFFKPFGNKFKIVRGIFDKIKNIPGFFKQGNLSAKRKKELEKLATARPELAWPSEKDISEARNAHRTNTFEELRDALKSDYDWMESDIRLEGPISDYVSLPGVRRPVAAHDSFQTNGILFEEWVGVVKASGRGMKVEIKENQALDDVLKILKKHEVSQKKLIINIGIPSSKEILEDKPEIPADSRIEKIRKAFPNCIINLSPVGDNLKDGHYSEDDIRQMARYAKAAGSPVMFPLRSNLVTPEVVKALKPNGKIALWNTTEVFTPEKREEEIRKFRQWGVDGMIDLAVKH